MISCVTSSCELAVVVPFTRYRTESFGPRTAYDRRLATSRARRKAYRLEIHLSGVDYC